jgi:hypothetical protein
MARQERLGAAETWGFWAVRKGKPEVIRPKRKLVLRVYKRLAGDSRRDQGLRRFRRILFTLPAGTRTMSSAAVSALATPRVSEVQST